MALVLVAGLTSGCGRKAFPVPPGTIRPTAIKDLSYRVTAKGVELSWSVPVRNRDGSPLTRIKGFELYKAELPEGEDLCPQCPPPFGPPIEIAFGARPEEARRMVYEDRTLTEGRRYVYEVRTVKGWFNVSDPSNRVSLVWHVPPSAPQAPSARWTDKGVQLLWHPTTTWLDGTPIRRTIFYRVYRARVGEETWEPVSSLQEATGLLDTSAKARSQYRYAVSAVVRFDDTEIEGPWGSEVTVEARDVVHLGAPEGLVAVAGAHGVRLEWRENTEPELAGYRVYRRDPNGYIDLLNHVPVTTPRFVDRTPLPPGRYLYWVTAVDDAHPPNEGSPSLRVSVSIESR